MEEAACCKFISVAVLHNKILVNVAVNIYISTLGNTLQHGYAVKKSMRLLPDVPLLSKKLWLRIFSREN